MARKEILNNLVSSISALFNKCLLISYCVHDEYLFITSWYANSYSVKFSDLPEVHLHSGPPCDYIITIESYTVECYFF